MTEHEWLELRRYLEEHDIEYETKIACIAGPVSSFVVILPPVVCHHNTPRDLENAYPEVTAAWNELQNELKGVEKK